ncbi:MAG: hypothetical protein EZS28_026125 [Streblomastix strix]|uniref:Uncharacterized protein n=1 Tax=Streblomastix strix TaxID=222440 RepID=A0A5J4V6L2_9EUKA|nr:MAG: hypothetical protein EZS28_026125 [Streblomastix strix]
MSGISFSDIMDVFAKLSGGKSGGFSGGRSFGKSISLHNTQSGGLSNNKSGGNFTFLDGFNIEQTNMNDNFDDITNHKTNIYLGKLQKVQAGVGTTDQETTLMGNEITSYTDIQNDGQLQIDLNNPTFYDSVILSQLIDGINKELGSNIFAVVQLIFVPAYEEEEEVDVNTELDPYFIRSVVVRSNKD